MTAKDVLQELLACGEKFTRDDKCHMYIRVEGVLDEHNAMACPVVALAQLRTGKKFSNKDLEPACAALGLPGLEGCLLMDAADNFLFVEGAEVLRQKMLQHMVK